MAWHRTRTYETAYLHGNTTSWTLVSASTGPRASIIIPTYLDPDGQLIASEAKMKQPKLKAIVASGLLPR